MTLLAPTTLIVQLTVDQLRDLLAEAVADREEPSPYLDQTGLAQRYQISVPTLRKLIGDGMPYVSVGEHKRFDVRETDEWMRVRSRSPEAAE